jgi:transposase-like protein
MAKMKLTPHKIAELRAAYEAWNPHDPDSESAAELAKRFGISKQTLYTLRSRWLEEDRRQRERTAELAEGDPAAGRAALEEVVRFLTAELVQAKLEIERLTKELDSAQGRPMELPPNQDGG